MRTPARLDVFFHWIRRVSAYRLFWLGVPILIYSWTLSGPFIIDDIHMLLRAERYHAGQSASLDLFRLAKTDDEWNKLRMSGVCPWWVKTGRLDLLRPLSEYSFYLDTLLFRRNVIGYRLVSLGIFICVLLAVHWMIKTACGDVHRAGATTFFYGISQTVTPPVTWMCNRSDLMVALGVTLAAGAYWKLRDRAAMRWIILGTLAYIFALLSKELAIALCPVVAIHEIIRRRQLSPSGSPARMRTTLTALLIASSAAYLGYYVYSRPWLLTGADGVPSQLNARLPLTLLLYSSVWTLGFPIDVLLGCSDWQTWGVAALGGIMTIIVIHYLRRSTRHDPAALFFALWAVAFMIPSLRALSASTRSLCVATIGWSYLLTGLILPAREADIAISRPLRHWFYMANCAFSLGCAFFTVQFMNRTELEARARLTAIANGINDGDSLVVMEAQSSAEELCPSDRLEFLTGKRNVAITYLLPPGIDASVKMEDNHTVTVRAKNRPLFDSALHQLTLPRSWRPERGLSYDLRDCKIEITDVSDSGRVTALRVRFNEPLGSPRIHFYPPLDGGATEARIARSN